MKPTKKYINSGAPLRAQTVVPDAEIYFYMNEYGLNEYEACLFAIQKEQIIIDMDLIYNRTMKDFRFIKHGFEYRIIIEY